MANLMRQTINYFFIYQYMKSFQDKNKRPLVHLNKGPLYVLMWKQLLEIEL